MTKKITSKDSIVEELASIKKLLILLLLKDGATQVQIATALGVDQGHISRMIPAKILRSKRKKK